MRSAKSSVQTIRRINKPQSRTEKQFKIAFLSHLGVKMIDKADYLLYNCFTKYPKGRKNMKLSKKIISVVLSIIMILSCVSVAFAASTYAGEYKADQSITIKSGDTIAEGAIFRGPVTIESGASVDTGTFNGAVTNNGTISGGVFNGSVTNNSGSFLYIVLKSGITGGTFNGTVKNTAGAVISGGTFNGTVTNDSGAQIAQYLLNSCTFNKEVVNNGTISTGIFTDKVTNTGKVSGGTFCYYIDNSGTVDSAVSAIVRTGNAYEVKGLPTLSGKLSISGNNTTFTVPKNTVLTVGENSELSLGCPCTVNGRIVVSDGGKITANGASLDASSAGTIIVPEGASFGGTSASKFDAITVRQHKITVESNVDKNQFSIAVAELAYKGDKVTYIFDLSGTANKCLTINSIKVYSGRKTDSNLIRATSDVSGSFDMPDNDVIIYVDVTANHTSASEHKDASCLLDGYDRTYCTKCQHQLSYTSIPAKGHSWSAWEYNTTSSKVLKTRTCSVCHAVDNAYIEIVNETAGKNLKVDYKSTMTFHANIKAEGIYTLQWVYAQDGQQTKTVTDDGSCSFTVTEAAGDFSVTALVIGSVTGSSETQSITVKHGFFDKIIAFFRGLFKKLPVYIDNVKQ